MFDYFAVFMISWFWNIEHGSVRSNKQTKINFGKFPNPKKPVRRAGLSDIRTKGTYFKDWMYCAMTNVLFS